MDLQTVSNWLTRRIARHAKLELSEVNIDTQFDEYGLDSLEIVGLTAEIEQSFSRRVPATALYEYPTIRLLTQMLVNG